MTCGAVVARLFHLYPILAVPYELCLCVLKYYNLLDQLSTAVRGLFSSSVELRECSSVSADSFSDVYLSHIAVLLRLVVLVRCHPSGCV